MSALRSSLRPCEAAEEVAAAVVAGPAAWGAGLLGDGFSVEELLDLEELCEVDKDGGFLCETAPAAEEEEKCSDSHGSSAVSYELMPLIPPEMDLPVRRFTFFFAFLRPDGAILGFQRYSFLLRAFCVGPRRGGTGVGVAYHGRLASRAPAAAAAPSASCVAAAAPPAAGKRRAGRGPYADPDHMRAFHGSVGAGEVQEAQQALARHHRVVALRRVHIRLGVVVRHHLLLLLVGLPVVLLPNGLPHLQPP